VEQVYYFIYMLH